MVKSGWRRETLKRVPSPLGLANTSINGGVNERGQGKQANDLPHLQSCPTRDSETRQMISTAVSNKGQSAEDKKSVPVRRELFCNH
jgi:hypothetical protein